MTNQRVVVDYAFTIEDSRLPDVLAGLQERYGTDATTYVVSLSPGHAEHLLDLAAADGHRIAGYERARAAHPGARVVVAIDLAAAEQLHGLRPAA